MNELFSHHFWGSKLEISDPRNSRNPIRFPALSNTYSNDFRYDPVLCPNKLIYRQQINSLKKRLILTLVGYSSVLHKIAEARGFKSDSQSPSQRSSYP